MIESKDWPIGITPDNYPEFIGRSSEHIVRRGKDMVGHFTVAPDPEAVIYEVYETEPAGNTRTALTVLKPGKVGDEYYMTKGHYHEDADSGETYICLKGEGVVLMQTRDGDSDEIWLKEGTVACIPPGWAHRTVNVGDGDFVMVAIYPTAAGHDYSSIEKSGFIKRVIEDKGKPKVIQQ